MIPHVSVDDLFLFIVPPTETTDYRIQIRLNFGGKEWRSWRLSGVYIEESAWWKHPRFPLTECSFMALTDAETACNAIAEFLAVRYITESN